MRDGALLAHLCIIGAGLCIIGTRSGGLSAAAGVGPRGARVVLTDKGPVGSLSGLAPLSFAAILLRSRLVRGAGSDA
jgi:predicted oxidoreductase